MAEDLIFRVILESGGSIKTVQDLIDRQKELRREIQNATDIGSSRFKALEGQFKKNQEAITQFNRNLRNSAPLAQRVSDGMISAFKKVGATLLGAFAIGSIINFAKQSVKAFDEQQKAVSALRVAIGGNTVALEAQADALQKTTLFTDENIIAAQATLALYTNERSEIEALTPLILDLAQAKGIDLKSAAERVGAALDGNADGLKKLGISVKDAATEEERFAIIQQGLNERVGGQAVAAAGAGTGGMRSFGVAVGELQEVFGGFIVGALTPFVRGAADAVNAIREFISPAKTQAEVFEEQRLRLNGLVGAITDANVREDDRLRLIKELQKEFPGFLKNITAETATNAELTIRLNEVNEQLINRIIIETQKAKIEKAATEVAKARIKATEDAIQIAQIEREVLEATGKTIDLNNKSRDEQLFILRQAFSAHITAAQGTEEFNDQISKQDRLVNEFLPRLSLLRGSIQEQVKVENNLNELENERNDILARLGINQTEVVKATDALTQSTKTFTEQEEKTKKTTEEHVKVNEKYLATVESIEDFLKRTEEQLKLVEQAEKDRIERLGLAGEQEAQVRLSAAVTFQEQMDAELSAIAFREQQEIEAVRRTQAEKIEAIRLTQADSVIKGTAEIEAKLLAEQQISSINTKFETDRLEVQKRFNDLKIQNVVSSLSDISGAFSQLGSLFDSQSAQAIRLTQLSQLAAQGAAVAQGFQAITKSATLPFPANIVAIATTVAAIASAFSTFGKLITPIETKKFAEGGQVFPSRTGGMIKGSSHRRGGVKFAVGGTIGEAEGEEFIVNRVATKAFLPVLEMINDAGLSMSGRVSSVTRSMSRFPVFQHGGVIPALERQTSISRFNDKIDELIDVTRDKRLVLSLVELRDRQTDLEILERNAEF